MGLSEIIDITQTQQPSETGELETVFEIEFLTEETSGLKTVTVPEDEFTPEVGRERAVERAEELDAAFTAG
jgi:predicted alternative tryptophan synthase beta-subunit